MPVHGELIGNTFYPPKDTIGGTGSCIYISLSDSVKIEKNKFYSNGYQWGGEPGSIAHIECNRAEFRMNYIEGLTYCRFTPEVKKINLSNNIFVDSKSTVFYFENECVATGNTFYNLKGWAYLGGHNQNAKFTDTNTIYFEGYPESSDSLLKH
jgi:hypothetical protein